jgi:hypothetical protein
MFPALEGAVLRSTAALAVDVDVDVDVAEGEAEAAGELPVAAGLVAAGVVPPPPAHPVKAAVRARMARAAPICFFMGCSFAGARRRYAER